MPPIYTMHHTHWDREWYEPFSLYQLRLGPVLQTVLDWLDDGRLPCFTLDGQTSLLTDALALRPDLAPRLKAHIQSGKLSIGPWFVSPDEWLVCGEALIRNLRRGIAESLTWGQQPPFVGYLPDTFGHSADMPDLLHAVGIHTAMVWRGVPLHLSPVFWWRSPTNPDVKVLVYHLPQGYFQNPLHDPSLTPEQRQTAFNDLVSGLTRQHGDWPVLVPLGGDHLGPTPDAASLSYPAVHPAAFMALLAGLADSAEHIPEYTGELLDNASAHVLPGVWSARLDLKIANRQAEHALLNRVEPALGWLRQRKPDHPHLTNLDAGLAEAWRLLLLNHPHDSICGCSVDAVHAENQTRFTAVLGLADRLVTQTLHAGLACSPPKSGPLTARHVLAHWGSTPYTGVVPVCFRQKPDEAPLTLPQVDTVDTTPLLNAYEADCWDVPLSHLTMRETRGWVAARDLPAGSVTDWSAASVGDLPPVEVTDHSLDNGLLGLDITPNGGWTLTQGERQQTDLFTLGLTEEVGDSYNSAPGAAPPAWAVFTGCRATLPGPLAGELCLTYDLAGMPVTVTVRLLAEQPFLDVTIRWFNTMPDGKVTAWLKQADPLTAVWAESHLSVVKRTYPLPHDPPPLPMPKGQEWLPPTGPIQRFLATPGQLVVTEGLTEYQVDRDRLGLTLHRGFGRISRGDNPTRNMPAGPPFETPAAQLLHQTLSRRLAVGLRPIDLTQHGEAGWDHRLAALGADWATRFYGVTHGHTVWRR